MFSTRAVANMRKVLLLRVCVCICDLVMIMSFTRDDDVVHFLTHTRSGRDHQKCMFGEWSRGAMISDLWICGVCAKLFLPDVHLCGV